MPEAHLQPQATLQSQAPKPSATVLLQPQVKYSKPEAVHSAPMVQYPVTVENPVVLPEVSWLSAEQSYEAQSNNR
jgi:cellobiose-specific phosphotransferase system component IIB